MTAALVDPTDPLSAYADLFDRPWWPVVRLLIVAGQNVVVFDPQRTSALERWSSRVEHGTVQVLPRLGAGWVVSVYEVSLLNDDLSDFRDETDESEMGDTPMPAPTRVRP